MYYSIPAVRSATMLLKDVDTSNLGASLFNTSSCPTRLHSHALQRNISQVQPLKVAKRSSILSVECHPDLLLEDMEDDLDEEDLNLGEDKPNDETYDSLEHQFEKVLRMFNDLLG